jgi:hypothetical protein
MSFYTHERNYGCRLMEHLYRGLRVVTMENDLVRISILADKGSDIFEFLYKPLDVDFMLRSPWGVRNPEHFVPTSHHATSAFQDYYEGGWQDVLPTGGKPVEYHGKPFGVHGETTTIPWDYQIIEDSPERIRVRFWVRTYRTPFFIEKELALERGKSILSIDERIVNEGRVTMDLMWGQHPALGEAFLDDSCRIDLPGGQVHCTELSPNTRFVTGVYPWPLVPGKERGTIDLRQVATIGADTADTLRISDLPQGWYAVTNTRKQVGFGMSFPLTVFPVLWFWQVYGGVYAAPWYGRCYTVALEPFSTLQGSVVAAAENKTSHVLKPGECIQAHMVAVALAGMTGVQQITPDGQIIPR